MQLLYFGDCIPSQMNVVPLKRVPIPPSFGEHGRCTGHCDMYCATYTVCRFCPINKLYVIYPSYSCLKCEVLVTALFHNSIAQLLQLCCH